MSFDPTCDSLGGGNGCSFGAVLQPADNYDCHIDVLEALIFACNCGLVFATREVGQDHMDSHFAWHNAKLFRFSPWEKAALWFQCILKSILHEKTLNELLVSCYTLLHACTKQNVCDHVA